MSTTPESVIKNKIKAILGRYEVYYFMPVQMGYGPTGLDFHCMIKWFTVPIAFFIEAKKPGGKITQRQDLLIARFEKFNAKVFVIDGPDGLKELEAWLIYMTKTSERRDEPSHSTIQVPRLIVPRTT